MKRLKKGDISSFDKLYGMYFKKVYLFARGILKSHEDAEYIVQEVFAKIWGKRKELDEYRSFESFVFTISHHACISLIRRKQRAKNFMRDWHKRMISQGHYSVDEAEHRDINERILSLVNQLPRRRKQVYLMSREEGLTYKEIAQRLGISVNTVENHMAASLKFLRKNLNDLLF